MHTRRIPMHTRRTPNKTHTLLLHIHNTHTRKFSGALTDVGQVVGHKEGQGVRGGALRVFASAGADSSGAHHVRSGVSKRHVYVGERALRVPHLGGNVLEVLRGERHVSDGIRTL